MLSKKVHKYVTDFPNYETANMEGVIAMPHLGASTEEAEDNCAFMASQPNRQFHRKRQHRQFGQLSEHRRRRQDRAAAD
ncbi:MAG: hypothetical protein MZU97_26630 [Bacillus subtilis]|nr:hypothetical protein [Bacillus subtilis]